MPQLRHRAARMAPFAIWALSGALFLVCAQLSYRRHLHVDELSALYSIQLGAAFGHPEYAVVELTSVLFQPLARVLASSHGLFVGFRALELALLGALCWSVSRVQQSLPSALGRASVFLGAVSFGPLWRHGFEVRHDLFVAFAVVLLVWAAERARAERLDWWAASATSFGVLIAQANSSKAFTIWLPGLVLCALMAARHRTAMPLPKRIALAALRFVPGLVLGGAFVAGVFAAGGVLGEYWRQLAQFTSFSAAPPYRLSALPLLVFAVERAPAHACFVAFGLLGAGARIARREPLAEAWAPLGACALCSMSIALNPTPFPYNLTWLTPAWLLLAAFGLAQSLAFLNRAPLRALLAGSAAALSLIFFWSCQRDPYYRKGWDAQLGLVARAEALTDPDEPVLDLCGLVISRPPVAKDWIVHSLYMPAYHAGQRESVRQIIARVWPPVAIGVYRWSFLDRADWLALRHDYVRFSDDLWTLGQALTPSRRQVQIQRAGRYQVRASGDAGTLDGKAIRGGDVMWLARGQHELVTSTNFTIAWHGPGDPGEPRAPASPLFEPGELPKQRDRR